MNNDALQEVLAYLKQGADLTGRMEERIETVKTDVVKLNRVVLDGEASLVIRLYGLSFEIKELQTAQLALGESLKSLKKDEAEIKKQKMQSIAAVVVALVSAIATIVVSLITLKR